MTAGSRAQAGSPASGAGKPAGPAAVTLRLEPVTLSKKEGWFRLGNGGTYAVVRRGKSEDKVTVRAEYRELLLCGGEIPGAAGSGPGAGCERAVSAPSSLPTSGA